MNNNKNSQVILKSRIPGDVSGRLISNLGIFLSFLLPSLSSCCGIEILCKLPLILFPSFIAFLFDLWITDSKQMQVSERKCTRLYFTSNDYKEWHNENHSTCVLQVVLWWRIIKAIQSKKTKRTSKLYCFLVDNSVIVFLYSCDS